MQLSAFRNIYFPDASICMLYLIDKFECYIFCFWKKKKKKMLFLLISCCWGSSTLNQEHFDLKSKPHMLFTLSFFVSFFLSCPTFCPSFHVVLTTLWQVNVEPVCCPVKRVLVIFHVVDISFEIPSYHSGTLSSLNQGCVKGTGGPCWVGGKLFVGPDP